MVSIKAITTKPTVPANESNNCNQYSPAPVQNINPMKKQHIQRTAIDEKFSVKLLHIFFIKTHQ